MSIATGNTSGSADSLGAKPQFVGFKRQVTFHNVLPSEASDPSCPTVQVILELQPESGVAVDQAMLDATIQTMYRRIIAFDMDAFDISAYGDKQVMVQLQGAHNPEAVVEVLRQTALLEFIDPEGAYLAPGTKVSTTLGGSEQDANADGSTYTTLASSYDLIGANRVIGPLGQPLVGITLSSEASDRIYNFTSQNVGRPISVVIDKTVISSPVIMPAVSNGLLIEGLSPDDIDNLVIQLNSGPLLASVEVVQSELRDTPCI